MSDRTPISPAAAQIVEIVARAIDEARKQNYHIQAFDYSRYGRKKPHVIRDLSLPHEQQTLWEGDDGEARDLEYVRIKRERVAQAALSALTAAGLSVVASAEADGWRPIESAPRDGTKIYLGRPGEEPVLGWWWTGDPQFPWQFFDPEFREFNTRMDGKAGFTHWRPLPPPPEGV